MNGKIWTLAHVHSFITGFPPFCHIKQQSHWFWLHEILTFTSPRVMTGCLVMLDWMFSAEML